MTDRQEVMRDVQSTLNKLVPLNFDAMASHLMELLAKAADVGSNLAPSLTCEIIDTIYNNSVSNKRLVKLFADLCVAIFNVSPALLIIITIIFGLLHFNFSV